MASNDRHGYRVVSNKTGTLRISVEDAAEAVQVVKNVHAAKVAMEIAMRSGALA